MITLPSHGKITRALGALALAAMIGGSAYADVIYRETFGRPPGVPGDLPTYTMGWHDFLASGQANTNPAAAGINGSTNGRPIDVANVNAGPNSDGTFGAYATGIHFFTAAAGPNILSFTTEFSFNPDVYVPGSIEFSWYLGNANAGDLVRLAVQVGSSWYASATTYNSPATTLGQFPGSAVHHTVTYNPAAVNWVTINFDGTYDGNTSGTAVDSSTPMSLGAAPLTSLGGTITGFGLYLEGAAGTRRFDTFEINATVIPEPSSVALLAGSAALAAGIVLRRRKRSA